MEEPSKTAPSSTDTAPSRAIIPSGLSVGRHDFPRVELRIVAVYIVLATSWIVLSDQALEFLTEEHYESALLQTYKGINFVITSACLLYLVLRSAHQRRRVAERESRETTERFELVAATANDAMWDLDLERNKLWWSNGFAALFGFAPSDADHAFEEWTAKVHPDDRAKVVQSLGELTTQGRRFWCQEYRFQREDGSYADVADHGFVVHDETGKPTRMVGSISDITTKKQTDRQLDRSRRQLRALSARLQTLREEERTRIAREIHDELGQMLTGLKMDLRWVERRLEVMEDHSEQGPLLDRLVEATELTDQIIACVQRIASDLRPDVLDSLGLMSALRFEAKRFTERAEIPCDLQLPDQHASLSAETQTTLFRIFQEALTNVARHAEADEVLVVFRDDAGFGVLEICDNGKGISNDALAGSDSLGLLGMRERAAMAGGELRIGRRQPKGTCLNLRLPLIHEPKE